MIKIEIYFKDLTEEKQKDVLDILGIVGPEDLNWDVLPISLICIE